MATNIVIDPVTRIEGHLRIEAELGADGKTITKAYSSSTMARGIEVIMQGRDPRDAAHISQRICGVCTVVHGLTAVRAVEDALGVKVPENAELIRNLMIGAQYIHDHVMHFYHLHALDWVDVVSALSADAAATAALAKSNNPDYYANQTLAALTTTFNGVKAKLKNLIDRGQLGLFANGYWGHPDYKLPPAGNLLAVAHYLDALGWAREVVKLHTIFGGKDPHPNLVVGGVPCAVSRNYNNKASEGLGGTSLNKVNMAKVTTLITKMKNFVDQLYVPDTILIAGFYKSQGSYTGWEKRGGTGWNYLCYGEFPENGIRDPNNFLIPQGVLEGNLSIKSLDMEHRDEIKEYVTHSWYKYLGVGNSVGLHPSEGQTNLDYAGRGGPAPGANYKLNRDTGYSWIKSPRWYDKPMEVGPLAHVVMMYAKAKSSPTTEAEKAHKRAKDLVDNIWVSKLGLSINDIDSTLGRIAARTIETSIITDAMSRWHIKLLSNISAGKLATFVTDADVVAQNPSLTGFKWTDTSTWNNGNPLQVGVGFTEAPRGALGHWLSIFGGKIQNYQCIVASQWNAGPRAGTGGVDGAGIPGPYEKSLEGHILAIPTQPLEILRTIHSFDPCIGCAVHVTDPNGEELIKVNISTTLR
ncbi:nickel-dependent hydrogenase large subunit [Methylobacter sp. S3L5C]|uniref:nickel-dependent hydrogenase large subunit n=1 Tax=Methylobacter sp. S3L5C TaxID=2839024 RepID=UPI001FAC4212|nr:nickel-dependent hydrogenase large subunit [Methylobacter sp. S3L5C]UOA08200.1 nickel-dependent hydrogenase large subunit [Methylobacter sp. S3L5C]